RAVSPCSSAPVVTISVYSRACCDSSRKKYRQWRSVQSIIGATEKRRGKEDAGCIGGAGRVRKGRGFYQARAAPVRLPAWPLRVGQPKLTAGRPLSSYFRRLAKTLGVS